MGNIWTRMLLCEMPKSKCFLQYRDTFYCLVLCYFSFLAIWMKTDSSEYSRMQKKPYAFVLVSVNVYLLYLFFLNCFPLKLLSNVYAAFVK